MAEMMLEAKNLKKYFKTARGLLHAVDDISFSIEKGKTLGLVGESGCGKSTTGRLLIRLLELTDGSVVFDGKDISKLKGREMRHMRTEMQMIFQDPFSSIDPRKTVSQTIREPIVANRILTGRAVDERVAQLMETVGLAERLADSYPHELDGGRRQRIGIARAMAMNPQFIVCDEPVSALDVSIQAQILNLLKDLQARLGLTYVFITHDLAVVNYFADEIAVMYLGQIVEKAPTELLFSNPVHPYTRALLSAIPVPEYGAKKERMLIKGEITSPIDPPDECRFAARCPRVSPRCRQGCPPLKEIAPGHYAACFETYTCDHEYSIQ